MKLIFNTIRYPDPEVNPGRSITFVKVEKKGEIIAEGEAIKRADEPFNQVVGFKYAVKNAVRNLAKSDRVYIWKGFFGHSKKTRQLIN